jgi:ComF family protein
MWLNDSLNLFFPELCCGCGNYLFPQEEGICDFCFYHLPRTGFHHHAENPVAGIFSGRVRIMGAASFLYFKKAGMVRNIVHALKYKGRTDLGLILGKEYGKELKSAGTFSECSLIVPVPLHWKKLRTRGYNQCEAFASGLSDSLGIPLSTDSLRRNVPSETQTHKSRFSRWNNVSGSFSVSGHFSMENTRILLVDDVITTGATIESCIRAIMAAGCREVAVATLAYARL